VRLSKGHLALIVGAMLLLVGGTIVQGRWTERWTLISRDAVTRAATLLEKRFPERFGQWELDRNLESNPKELKAAGAVGHISRSYRNTRSKNRISAFVVCALPYDASAHTPDRCYPGAGFTIGEAEHLVRIDVAGKRTAEAFTGTFVKAGETLRIFWTYGVPGDTGDDVLDWRAPQLARIALSGEPSVYKLYVIADQTRIGPSQSMLDCENFIAELVPAFDAALQKDGESAEDASAASAAAGAPATPLGDSSAG